MNSYERELCYPKMDNEVLLETVEYCLKNCQRYEVRRPAACYDDAMFLHFVPMLIERLKEEKHRQRREDNVI